MLIKKSKEKLTDILTFLCFLEWKFFGEKYKLKK